MKSKIKVLLVDDHSIVREGLRMVLESVETIEVCGEAGTLKQAMHLTAESLPDVVVLDYRLPDGDGITGTINLKARFPNIKVLILTAYTQDEVVTGAIRAGIDGFLLKDADSNELIRAIQSIAKGTLVLDSSTTASIFDLLRGGHSSQRVKVPELTQQEERILQLVALGKTNKEIADSMAISDKTVRNYLSKAFRKLNVSNRTEAASYWINTMQNRDKCT